MDKLFIKKILLKVMTILDSPTKWIKGSMARDADYERISAVSSLATCWCLDGAVYKAMHDIGIVPNLVHLQWNDPAFHKANNHFNAVTEYLRPYHPSNFNSYVGFNDDANTTYEDVIRLLQQAIDDE